MKLQRKYQLNLFKTISILSIPFILLLFTVINYFIQDEIKELLEFQREKIIIALDQGEEVVSIEPTIIIEKVKKDAFTSTFSTVLVYDILAREFEEYLQLASIVEIKGQHYNIIVRTVTVEKSDLLISILIVTIILLITLGTIFYFISNRSFKLLFDPFQKSLKLLKGFSLTEEEHLSYVPSEIDEFDDLSKTTSILTGKIISDYQNLKQFTENASHEIQTPLAVIRNNVEQILNEERLTEYTSQALDNIDKAVNNLSSINKGLILLSKIENKQFVKPALVDIGEIIEQEVLNLYELYMHNEHHIELYEKSEFRIEMNSTLAGILVRNLIKNMVNHSDDNSFKSIEITSTEITFINEGINPLLETKKVFNRFYKLSSNEGSIGLGLSIVQAICDQYDLNILYRFENSHHTFVLSKTN